MEFQVTDAILIAVIMGLVEVATRFLGLAKRFAPLLALILGVAGGVLYIFPSDPKLGVLVGLIMGLTAVGLYSGVKNTIEPRDDL